MCLFKNVFTWFLHFKSHPLCHSRTADRWDRFFARQTQARPCLMMRICTRPHATRAGVASIVLSFARLTCPVDVAHIWGLGPTVDSLHGIVFMWMKVLFFLMWSMFFLNGMYLFLCSSFIKTSFYFFYFLNMCLCQHVNCGKISKLCYFFSI